MNQIIWTPTPGITCAVQQALFEQGWRWLGNKIGVDKGARWIMLWDDFKPRLSCSQISSWADAPIKTFEDVQKYSYNLRDHWTHANESAEFIDGSAYLTPPLPEDV